ncbi:Chitinase 2 [Coemansia sp. RSA 1813]|nr:Chitinase 2 [Coemansia sp. RSA 986]KAJ2573482.1 Chitinase 2 [Coemansia sp. RSA 1813]
MLFNVNCNSNYASYYGQNSARNQKSLGKYCKDTTEDIIVLAFMNGFPNVLLNFANACETTFDGSTLLHCPSMAEDIKYCQSQGKAVIISMGGASGAYGFYSEKQGTEFADTVWNMFFKGSADQRPFDDAVLDGIDLDIEGGSGIGYTAFIERLRSHYATDQSKEYYIAAAPQCPYPDAYLGSTLNSAWFDMVYVQFYNNYCGLNAYPSWFNFEDWDNWAKTASVNKDVKIFIGAPGSPSAASSGYVDGSRLSTIYNAVRAKYTSLGGIMTWDVSQARTSGLASSIRSMLDASGSCSGKPPYETTTNTGTTSSTNTYADSHPTSSDTLTSTDRHHGDSETLTTRTVTLTKTITSVSTITPAHLSTVTITSSYTSYITQFVTVTEPLEPYSNSSASSNHDTTQINSTTLTSSSEPLSTPITQPSSLSETNATVSSCLTDGAPCVEGTEGCNESGYALCINGKWSVYSCYSGTTCYIWGNIAICDWEGQHPKDKCMIQGISRNINESDLKNALQRTDNTSSPTAVYTTRGISSRIELVPLAASNGQFKALIKIQTLLQPISKHWVLELQMPKGQSIDHTSVGRLSAHYPKASIISADYDVAFPRMALSIEISGRYLGSYRIPNIALAKIDNY